MHKFSVVAFAALASLTVSSPAHATSDCSVSGSRITCSYSTHTLSADSRKVYYKLPNSTAPSGGYPVAVVFQGSFMPAKNTFNTSYYGAYGAYYLAETVDMLLDEGYAVIAPNADAGTFWDVNQIGYNTASSWWNSEDADVITELIDAIDDGTFGNLNGNDKHAFGLSSGGYMASGASEYYPGEFDSIVVHSAAYASCAGMLYYCSVPTLSSSHAPTLIIHGGMDTIVPSIQSYYYANQLASAGVDYEREYVTWGGHQYFSSSPDLIVDWITSH